MRGCFAPSAADRSLCECWPPVACSVTTSIAMGHCLQTSSGCSVPTTSLSRAAHSPCRLLTCRAWHCPPLPAKLERAAREPHGTPAAAALLALRSLRPAAPHKPLLIAQPIFTLGLQAATHSLTAGPPAACLPPRLAAAATPVAPATAAPAAAPPPAAAPATAAASSAGGQRRQHLVRPGGQGAALLHFNAPLEVLAGGQRQMTWGTSAGAGRSRKCRHSRAHAGLLHLGAGTRGQERRRQAWQRARGQGRRRTCRILIWLSFCGESLSHKMPGGFCRPGRGTRITWGRGAEGGRGCWQDRNQSQRVEQAVVSSCKRRPARVPAGFGCPETRRAAAWRFFTVSRHAVRAA